MKTPARPSRRWLLLAHQLPARPSNARVKTWRRLQQLGALPFRNSVYVLPEGPQGREDLAWLATEIRGVGGDATVFAADVVDAAAEAEIVAGFCQARTGDYAELRKQTADTTRRLLKLKQTGGLARRRFVRAARALGDRLAEIESLDFAGSPGRDEARRALESLDAHLRGTDRSETAQRDAPTRKPPTYRRRVWVTRPRPGVDRMASAWLIRRFVDPAATFAFAEQAPAEGDRAAVPFDMFSGGFGHRGDRCTFEVLADTFAVTSPSVRRLADLVHDLDFKDDRYESADASVVGRMIEGLRQTYSKDQQLLEQGIVLFESLYQSYERDAVAAPRRKKARRRGK